MTIRKKFKVDTKVHGPKLAEMKNI